MWRLRTFPPAPIRPTRISSSAMRNLLIASGEEKPTALLRWRLGSSVPPEYPSGTRRQPRLTPGALCRELLCHTVLRLARLATQWSMSWRMIMRYAVRRTGFLLAFSVHIFYACRHDIDDESTVLRRAHPGQPVPPRLQPWSLTGRSAALTPCGPSGNSHPQRALFHSTFRLRQVAPR